MSAEDDDADAGLSGACLKPIQPRRRVRVVRHDAGERHHAAEGLFRTLLAEGLAVPLAKVYRVLAQLERAGIVRRPRTVAAARGSERGDPRRVPFGVCGPDGWGDPSRMSAGARRPD